MPLPQEKVYTDRLYTVDDIYALPEGHRAELINGVIYDMATPTRTHQRYITFLIQCIGNYIDSKEGPCEVDPAPFAVFLNKDRYNYFEPDITVVCDRDKLDDKGCHGAPDWIIEIVSPSSRKLDYQKKMLKYCSAKVREYWVVDPDESKVTVYDFENEEIEEYTLTDDIKVGIYEDLVINFSNVLL